MGDKVGTFILGVIAAVVLFMLWKKERGSADGSAKVGPQPPASVAAPGTGASTCAGDCTGCGTGGACASSPSAAVSPAFQSAMASLGMDGQITPGTPPLGGIDTSFYTSAGVTTDQSFTFIPPSSPSKNVPGSATTPAYATPVRAQAPVGQYSDNGFVSHYNISGVPGSARRKAYLQ